MSVDMTSSGKNSLNIRTNASPKWDKIRCPEQIKMHNHGTLKWDWNRCLESVTVPTSILPLWIQIWIIIGEKGRDLTQSYDKSPYTHRKIQKAIRGQMYPAELEIKNTTESHTSVSNLDLLLSIGGGGGGTISFALPFKTNVTMSTSISQTFRSLEKNNYLHPPMVFLSHSWYEMTGLTPLMNVLLLIIKLLIIIYNQDYNGRVTSQL